MYPLNWILNFILHPNAPQKWTHQPQNPPSLTYHKSIFCFRIVHFEPWEIWAKMGWLRARFLKKSLFQSIPKRLGSIRWNLSYTSAVLVSKVRPFWPIGTREMGFFVPKKSKICIFPSFFARNVEWDFFCDFQTPCYSLKFSNFLK